MNPRITIAAIVAALSIITIASADARPRQTRNVPTIDVAAIPAYPFPDRIKGHRAASPAASRGAAVVWTSRHGTKARGASTAPSLGERTLGGYAIVPEAMPPDQAARFGLITVDVAGGHRITVSPDFAGLVVPLIADLHANGKRFTRIKCAASRGQGHHVRRSNHWTGDACDFFGMHPDARTVRAHGLRSGRDFADSMHVDNARNVGGVDYWNSVKHKGHAVTASGGRPSHQRRVRVARR